MIKEEDIKNVIYRYSPLTQDKDGIVLEFAKIGVDVSNMIRNLHKQITSWPYSGWENNFDQVYDTNGAIKVTLERMEKKLSEAFKKAIFNYQEHGPSFVKTAEQVLQDLNTISSKIEVYGEENEKLILPATPGLKIPANDAVAFIKKHVMKKQA